MIVGYQSNLTYSDGLYWRSHTGSASGKTFTYDGAVDPNIHAGGLVKINGVIYKIEGNGTSGRDVRLCDSTAYDNLRTSYQLDDVRSSCSRLIGHCKNRA